jgi:hypothetical protein
MLSFVATLNAFLVILNSSLTPYYTTYVNTYTYLQSANIGFVGIHAKLQHIRMEDYA